MKRPKCIRVWSTEQAYREGRAYAWAMGFPQECTMVGFSRPMKNARPGILVNIALAKRPGESEVIAYGEMLFPCSFQVPSWAEQWPHAYVVRIDVKVWPGSGVPLGNRGTQNSGVEISYSVAQSERSALRARYAAIVEALIGGRFTTRKIERTFSVGQVLSRVYNGKKHSARFTSAGRFRYRGEDYRSLSAVARKITGRKTSGPGFFGV